jgi:hypothetical protein
MYALKKTYTILVERLLSEEHRRAASRRLQQRVVENQNCVLISVHDSRCGRLTDTVGDVETRGGFQTPRSAFGTANVLAMEGVRRKKGRDTRVMTSICRRCLPGA